MYVAWSSGTLLVFDFLFSGSCMKFMCGTLMDVVSSTGLHDVRVCEREREKELEEGGVFECEVCVEQCCVFVIKRIYGLLILRSPGFVDGDGDVTVIEAVGVTILADRSDGMFSRSEGSSPVDSTLLNKF